MIFRNAKELGKVKETLKNEMLGIRKGSESETEKKMRILEDEEERLFWE